jgi:hypothetical protein
MNKNKNGKQEQSMPKILKEMKSQLKDLDIKWSEEEKFFDHYEFLLSYK